MKYFKQLDGLRTIAVGLVIIEHFAYFIGKHFSAGYYGVDLFFVISGFLITGILVNSNEPFSRSYKKFIGRRALRIFPIYYLTIFLLFFIGDQYMREYFVYCLTYTYNYAWVYFNIPLNSITHFWSLCVEEQFYLIWPFIILGLRQNILALKILVIALISLCALQICLNIFPQVTPYNNAGLFPRAASLAIGALGAIFYKENKIPWRLLENKYLEYAAIVILVFFLFTDFRLKYVVCPLLSLFIILKTTHKGFRLHFLNSFLKNRRVIYLGTISYGIYIFHRPIGVYGSTYLVGPLWDKIDFDSMGFLSVLQWHSWIIKLPLYSIITVLAAHLSYKYLEKPILSLKDRWFKYKPPPKIPDGN